MSASAHPGRAKAGVRTVARLEQQAVLLRAELVSLKHDVARVRRDFSGMRAAQLLEANEHLVVAALHAESIAETATGNLSELTRTSQHDPLTDTPKRLLMIDRIESAIATALRRGTRLAELFSDLDHFKMINDTFGHAAGDEVLQLASQRLRSDLRDSDTVSRHGGDEFVVLLPEIGKAGDAGATASKMLTALAATGRIGSRELPLSASIGIALFPEDCHDPATLIAHADAAMYRAKGRGRNCFRFHAPQGASGHAEAAPMGRLSDGREARQARVAREARNEMPAPDSNALVKDLQQANEQVLSAALAARELQATAEHGQRRQARQLAIMAHELRSPMAPIRAAAGLLKRVVKDEPMLAQLKGIIESQVDSMSGLLDDLIDDSRTGPSSSPTQTRLERHVVELGDIIDLAAQMYRPAMNTR